MVGVIGLQRIARRFAGAGDVSHGARWVGQGGLRADELRDALGVDPGAARL
jgi:hypothetical protein